MMVEPDHVPLLDLFPRIHYVGQAQMEIMKFSKEGKKGNKNKNKNKTLCTSTGYMLISP